VICVVACSWPSDEIDAREAFWFEKISQVIPAGTPLQNALELGRKFDSNASFSSEQQVVTIILERLQIPEKKCPTWYIYARIPVESGETDRPSIESAGVCT